MAAAMKYCRKCGAVNQKEVKFCIECGTEFTAAKAEAASSPVGAGPKPVFPFAKPEPVRSAPEPRPVSEPAAQSAPSLQYVQPRAARPAKANALLVGLFLLIAAAILFAFNDDSHLTVGVLPEYAGQVQGSVPVPQQPPAPDKSKDGVGLSGGGAYEPGVSVGGGLAWDEVPQEVISGVNPAAEMEAYHRTGECTIQMDAFGLDFLESLGIPAATLERYQRANGNAYPATVEFTSSNIKISCPDLSDDPDWPIQSVSVYGGPVNGYFEDTDEDPDPDSDMKMVDSKKVWFGADGSLYVYSAFLIYDGAELKGGYILRSTCR